MADIETKNERKRSVKIIKKLGALANRDKSAPRSDRSKLTADIIVV